jgi:cob(I)alamin adenosyltransferase
MGHRLSKIYTRTGDRGTTSIGNGRRVDKDHAQVEASGSIDELNSVIGLLACEALPADVASPLAEIQQDLFDLGGDLCVPERGAIDNARVGELEQILDRFNADLAPLDEFILPGGSRAAALCHVARTVCRRAERRLVTLRRSEPVADAALTYLNRLSDLLFVLARALNRHAGNADVQWRPRKNKTDE